MRERIGWIDVARGIAILSVILVHCIGNITEGNEILLAWNMPLFFFLSGLCAYVPERNFKRYLAKKAKTLLLPQIVLGILCTIADVFIIKRVTFSVRNILDEFFYWFLIDLFYVVIIFYFVCKCNIERKRNQIVVLVAALVVAVSVYMLHVPIVLCLAMAPMAFLFYFLGFCLKDSFELVMVKVQKNGSGVWILLIPVVIICAYYNDPILMYLNLYGNLVLFFIGAVAGGFAVCLIAKLLENNRLLGWYGKNSLYIYVIHFTLLRALHLVGKTIFPQLAQKNYLYPYFWIYFMLAVVMFIPIIWLCEHFFAPLFGKKRI